MNIYGPYIMYNMHIYVTNMGIYGTYMSILMSIFNMDIYGLMYDVSSITCHMG
jgi:hypothetical protein